MRSTIDWVIIIAVAALAATAARWALPWMSNVDGGFGPTVLSAQHPGSAVVALLGVVVVIFFLAIGAAGRIGPLSAMGAVGAGLGWGALGLDGMRTVLVSQGGGVVAVDGIIWTGLLLVLSWLLFARHGGVRSVEPDSLGQHPDPLVSGEAIRAAVIGMLTGVLAAWLITRTDLRQQTAVAAALGGMACGFAGRLAAPHVQPVLLPPALVLVGTLAGWVSWMVAPEDIEVALAAGNVPVLLLPLPIDWAAGGLLGVPLGFAAAHGFLHHDDEGEAASPSGSKTMG